MREDWKKVEFETNLSVGFLFWHSHHLKLLIRVIGFVGSVVASEHRFKYIHTDNKQWMELGAMRRRRRNNISITVTIFSCFIFLIFLFYQSKDRHVFEFILPSTLYQKLPHIISCVNVIIWVCAFVSVYMSLRFLFVKLADNICSV